MKNILKFASLILALITVSTMMLASCGKQKSSDDDTGSAEGTAVVTSSPINATPIDEGVESEISGKMWQNVTDDGAITFLAFGINGVYTLNRPNQDFEKGTYAVDEDNKLVDITLEDGTKKVVNYSFNDDKTVLIFGGIEYTIPEVNTDVGNSPVNQEK